MGSRVVVISGAGRGIGRAAAIRFLRSGDRVALMSRTASEIDETIRLAAAPAGDALAVPGDVSDAADVQRAINATLKQFGRVDILVNAAGVAPLGTMEELTLDDFDRMLAVNARGVFLACRAVWGPMTRQGTGIIVNVSSVAARDPFPGLTAYGGTKAFVETLTLGLATEGRERGIRVFGVAPGAVQTRMLLDLFPAFPEDQMLKPDNVAGLIEWLCDPRCAHSSGQTVTIRRHPP